jgi:hypothetical protein
MNSVVVVGVEKLGQAVKAVKAVKNLSPLITHKMIFCGGSRKKAGHPNADGFFTAFTAFTAQWRPHLTPVQPALGLNMGTPHTALVSGPPIPRSTIIKSTAVKSAVHYRYRRRLALPIRMYSWRYICRERSSTRTAPRSSAGNSERTPTMSNEPKLRSDQVRLSSINLRFEAAALRNRFNRNAREDQTE